ncbi:Hypothetical protein, putative [Bodo saltans]|uniref:Protein kinase domain-containing protein n=1 Tax=Bodo saltans TaxID=75058 RepID=A0A0S4J120_BODSA|nr:Hypothetical protein, putative [Bodo saltans]|eukprot:CUG39117.1 Hypothetical protein, putative [Bodo saltans]
MDPNIAKAAPHYVGQPTVASVLTLDFNGPAYSGKTGGSPKVRRHSSGGVLVNNNNNNNNSSANNNNTKSQPQQSSGDTAQQPRLMSPASSSSRLHALSTQPPTPSGKSGASLSPGQPAALQPPPAASRRLNFTGNIDIDDTPSATPPSATPTGSRSGGAGFGLGDVAGGSRGGGGGTPSASTSPSAAVLSPPNVSFGVTSGVDPTSFAMQPYQSRDPQPQQPGSPQIARSTNSGLFQRGIGGAGSQNPSLGASRPLQQQQVRGNSKPGEGGGYGAPGTNGGGLETILGNGAAVGGGNAGVTAVGGAGSTFCNVRPAATLRVGVVQISASAPHAEGTTTTPPPSSPSLASSSLVAATAAIRTFVFPTLPPSVTTTTGVKGSGVLMEGILQSIVQEFTALISSASDHAAYADYVALNSSGGYSGTYQTSTSSHSRQPRSRSVSAGGVGGRIRLSATLQEDHEGGPSHLTGSGGGGANGSNSFGQRPSGLSLLQQHSSQLTVEGSTLSDTLMPPFSAEVAASSVHTEGDTSSASPLLLDSQPTQLMLSDTGDAALAVAAAAAALEPQPLPLPTMPPTQTGPPASAVFATLPAWSVSPAFIVKEVAPAATAPPPHPKYNHRRSESSAASLGGQITSSLYFGTTPPNTSTTTTPASSTRGGAVSSSRLAPSSVATPCIVVVQPFINNGNILDRFQSWSSRGATTRPSRVDQEIVIRRILWSVLEQLAVIHDAGEAHGSVKATNVFAWRDVAEAQQAAATGTTLHDNDEGSFHAAVGRTTSNVGGGVAGRRRSSKARHAAMGPLDWCTDAVLVDGIYHRLDEAARKVFERESNATSDAATAAALAAISTEWARLQEYDYVLPPECLQRTAAADVTSGTFDASSTAGSASSGLPPLKSSITPTSTTTMPDSPFSMSVVSQGSISKRLTPAADLWNVGLLAIHLADGGFPTWLRRQAKPVPSLSSSSGWSHKFHSFVQVCVSLNPEQRSSARELLEDPWFQSVIMPTPVSDMVSAAASSSSRQNLATLPRNEVEEALLINSLLQHLHLRASSGNKLHSVGSGDEHNGGVADGASPSTAPAPRSAAAAAAASSLQPSVVSRPLRHLFDVSEDGRRVFLPQRNYLQTMAELEYCCLQQVVATKRSLEASHRGLMGSSTFATTDTLTSPAGLNNHPRPPHANITMPSQLLPTVTMKASFDEGNDDDVQQQGIAGAAALQPRESSVDSGGLHLGDEGGGNGDGYLFGHHITTGDPMMVEYNAMLSRLGGGSSGGQGDLSSRQLPPHSARSRSSSDLTRAGGNTAAAMALSSNSAGSTGVGGDVSAFMLSGNSDSTQQPWGSGVDGFMMDKYASIASSTAMGQPMVSTTMYRTHAPPSPRKPYVPGEPLPTLTPLSNKPPFLAAFLATMEQCRREALLDCGYIVVTSTTKDVATSSSIPSNESIITIQGEDLSATQRREVDTVDQRFAGLTQAFLDLYDLAPICGDQWVMSILQAMRKHTATEDLIEPVIRCWKQKKQQQQQQPLSPSVSAANHAVVVPSTVVGGGMASSQQQQPSQKAVGPNNSVGGDGVSGGDAIVDATPTDFNNFLFSKWMTLGALTLQER